MIVTLVITWRSALVMLLASVSTYCILLVLQSYLDHPTVVALLHGSEDYRRWKDQ